MSMSWLEEVQHLKIPFEKIELATDKFKSFIGKGGFGLVYKGELTLPGGGGLATVAVKRLDSRLTGQGSKEFMMEIQLLSRYKHQNLISLLGFCEESNEKILVYEYAEHGSLDRYLRTANTTHCLTWMQRLNICVGAARGLDYLHNGVAEHYRIIHRDIKSSNILLDQNWDAKISDFGLSKIGVAKENNSYIISNVCGTQGYLDPAYMYSGVLTKESDVYSFGIVLFEVLCGRPCFEDHQDERRFLGPLAKSYYEKRKLDDIIDPKLRKQMDANSLDKFSAIANQCLLEDRRQRPLISAVVEELEKALEYQERGEFEETYWEKKLPQDYEDIIKMLGSLVIFATKKELFSLLRSGILFDMGRRFVRVDDNGEISEMVAATEFAYPESRIHRWKSVPGTRFPTVAEILGDTFLSSRIQVRPRFLSTGIVYAANLVFRFRQISDTTRGIPVFMGISCEFEEANMSWTSNVAEWIDNEWMVIELWHFISHDKNPEFEVSMHSYSNDGIFLAGIEFQPLRIMEDEETIVMEVESLADAEWEKKLPNDYQEIIDRSDTLNYVSKKELYYFLCEGILIDNGKMWFAINKLNGKKCHALPALEAVDYYKQQKWEWTSLSRSRFGKVTELRTSASFTFTYKIRNDMLTKGAAYSCYLTYDLLDFCHGLTFGLKAQCILKRKSQGFRAVPLTSKSPMLKPKNEKITHDSSTTPKPIIKGLPKQRKDGWMEVLLWEFTDTSLLDENPELYLKISTLKGQFVGIILEGIEFRPM